MYAAMTGFRVGVGDLRSGLMVTQQALYPWSHLSYLAPCTGPFSCSLFLHCFFTFCQEVMKKKKTKNKPSLSLSDSPSVLVFSDPETEKMSFISLQISQYVLLHCNGKESRRHRSSVTVSDLVKLTHVPNGKASSDKKSADFTVEISCDSHTGATFKASER